MKYKTCVISGSFRKFYKGIVEVIDIFTDAGIEVLSPKRSKVVDLNAEFVLLVDDASSEIKELEENHLNAISRGDFLYVYNPLYKGRSYIGASVIFELGFAVAHKKPVYSYELIEDVMLREFVAKVDYRELCLGVDANE